MGVGEPNINNIMGGIENTGSVRLHNHRKKLKQRFDIIKKLGQGTYGKVQLGINKETGQEVAIKTIKKSKIETEADLVRIRREIQIMSSVQHPNIIHIYEVFENREKMVLVMEYAAGGELYDYLSERKVLAEEEARRIFRQIATACYYCHKHKICHRDLKLENILLDENGNAKIADFGLSNVFDEQRLLSTFCGSPLYASPEIVKGTPYQGPEVDCWSLGVLLYTLVYGAMPFDGSNFKRLVKQISQGDYFEPKKPSRASPLIRDMLTVNPKNRANIEKICAHWWVNEGYDESCLEISEDLANQTPVRLDLLLSLAPPPPQLESEKLMVTGDAVDENLLNPESALPTRSQSVGSLMELTNPAERRIKDLLTEDVKQAQKRKLESTVSTDQVNLTKDGVKRKEKIIKENTVADITRRGAIEENASLEDASMSEVSPVAKSSTQTLSLRDMDVEQTEENDDPSNQGAACAELIEEAAKKVRNQSNKETPNKTETKDSAIVENNITNKENIVKEKKAEEKPDEKQKQEQSKIPAKRKSIKKKVLTDKNENETKSEKSSPVKNEKTQEGTEQSKSKENKNENDEPAQPPSKPVERRRSRIFETAEKFQKMISANENKTPGATEKPKKLIIKKDSEQKSSPTSPSKKASPDQKDESPEEKVQDKTEKQPVKEEKKIAVGAKDKKTASSTVAEQAPVEEKEKQSQVKNAVNVIANVIDKDGTKKSKSRPCCMVRKPPVPFGSSGRSASGSIPTVPSPGSPSTATAQESPQSVHGSTPAQVIDESKEEAPEESKTSSAEITLKSATLPRRKTTKAEIKLDYPAPKPATMGFKTEMAHHVEVPPKIPTQRSEVTFPVSSPTSVTGVRSASVEPETKSKTKQSPRERIIPISFEKETAEGKDKKESVSSPPTKPPTTKILQNQKSTVSQRSNSLSRQSTQESDSETATSVSGEPIRKSPREYIIPIAMEGGGYVTPRAGSLEPSDTTTSTSTMTSSKSKFGRNRRLNEREGSEDESPFSSLHRHSSFGRDSDTEDSRRDMFRMHSLRSSRPRKAAIEHNDSFSSGEDDDDDGFEILTAENLFSTLLSRVRDLTQRLNVDGRPGFPTTRLLTSHFSHGDNFWNMHNRPDPISRFAPIGRSSREQSVESTASSRSVGGAPWRRSVSRDLASDIESVFNSTGQPPTHTATLPRGDSSSNRENLNLTDLDLKKLKLSEEDALALSYLTPGLSRRIQKQLLAQLAPSEARKLSRTLSMRENKSPTNENKLEDERQSKTLDRPSSTLPTTTRRYSVETSPARYYQSINEPNKSGNNNKSFLPVVKSSNSAVEGRRLRSPSILESKPNYLSSKIGEYSSLPSPDSSTSDSLSSSKLDDSSRLSKYLSPSVRSYNSIDNSKTDVIRRSPSTTSNSGRRTSRFLRPDFYDAPKEENYYLKEKKERELETQKVLKEIRDKRKSRFRDRSANRESSNCEEEIKKPEITPVSSELTSTLLKNVSDNIKNLETNVKAIHDYVNIGNNNDDDSNKIHDYVNVQGSDRKIPDYVNVTNETSQNPVVRKERPSKIARPKSYPSENQNREEQHHASSKSPEKSKIAKSSKKSSGNGEQPNKNKFLQTIEKKFEKLRSFSNSPTTSVSSEEAKAREEKKSLVEDAIKRLREQSLPRNTDTCITESGLIKRAVSVEDMTNSETKLPASRKSVTKILNLFKKYEEKDKGGSDGKKSSSNSKTKKAQKSSKSNKNNGQSSQLVVDNEKTDENKDCDESKPLGAVITVISNDNSECDKVKTNEVRKPAERPKSLLISRSIKQPHQYNGARSDSNISSTEKDLKMKGSKLPVTLFRRSLNLDANNPQLDPPKFYKNPQSNTETIKNLNNTKYSEPTSACNSKKENHNSHVVDNSVLLSPSEDNDNASCDSWSVCSDYQNQELRSPVSPCNHFYSADENESVSDRIRRKSFYSRFNEKKRPRKSSLSNYRDLDLYKDTNNKKLNYKPVDFSTLDRRSVDLGTPSKKLNYSSSTATVTPESLKKEYKPYGRSNTAFVNDRYVNVPSTQRFPMYSPRVNRRSTSVYGPDSEDIDDLDDNIATGKNRMYSYYNQPSRHTSNNRPISPMLDGQLPLIDTVSSSVNQNNIHSSSSQDQD